MYIYKYIRIYIYTYICVYAYMIPVCMCVYIYQLVVAHVDAIYKYVGSFNSTTAKSGFFEEAAVRNAAV